MYAYTHHTQTLVLFYEKIIADHPTACIPGSKVTVSDGYSTVQISHGHKREKSLNLMDMSGSANDLVESLDVLSTQQSTVIVRWGRRLGNSHLY